MEIISRKKCYSARIKANKVKRKVTCRRRKQLHRRESKQKENLTKEEKERREKVESVGEIKRKGKMYLSWVSRWVQERRRSWTDPKDLKCRVKRSHKAENAKLNMDRGVAKRHRCSGRRSSRWSCRRSSFAILVQRKKGTNPERDYILYYNIYLLY